MLILNNSDIGLLQLTKGSWSVGGKRLDEVRGWQRDVASRMSGGREAQVSILVKALTDMIECRLRLIHEMDAAIERRDPEGIEAIRQRLSGSWSALRSTSETTTDEINRLVDSENTARREARWARPASPAPPSIGWNPYLSRSPYFYSRDGSHLRMGLPSLAPRKKTGSP